MHLRSLVLLPILMAPSFTYANQTDSIFTVGVVHKDVFFELPTASGNANFGAIPPVIGIQIGKRVSNNLSFEFEAGAGYTESTTTESTAEFDGFTLTSYTEEYTGSVDHMISFVAHYRPFGLSLFRPYLLAGANATSITIDYAYRDTFLGPTFENNETKTYNSTGATIGFGAEFYIWNSVELQSDYQSLLHMDEYTNVFSIGLNFEW